MLGMSRQEMFDKVCNHLRSMSRRSTDSAGNCLYRSPNGLKCAIGALIPDDLYDENMDKIVNISRIYIEFPSLRIQNVDIPFLDGLQKIHDSASYWDSLGFNYRGENGLLEFAEEYNLTYTPKKEI